MTGKELAQAVENFVNTTNSQQEHEAFIYYITYNAHRTLQQNIMRLVIRMIKSWAFMRSQGMFDARNEATVKLCEKIWDNVEKDDVYLPYI